MKQVKRKRAGLKVGVTIFVRGGQQSLWENGIFQNCYFLILLLNKSPLVDKAFLVNGGGGKLEESGDFLALAPAPLIDLATANDELDVIIELSAQLDKNWIATFREKGGRVVSMNVANDYVIDIERMIFGLPPGKVVSGAHYDAIWTLPAFEKTCLSYYKVALRAPVAVMQHLWSPLLLERAVQNLPSGKRFEYVPGRRTWRLAVFEPNICMVKTAHIPMLLSDVAHRQDPDFIERLSVYSSQNLAAQDQFVQYARSLNLVRHGIALFESRLPLYHVMTNHAEAIVSHHWENGQNYVYYEALYGGFPLIHNSTLLDDCGYYYPDFDCDEGALALRQAFREHDRELSSYRGRAQQFLQRLDPESPRNVESYGAAIQALFT